MRRIVVLLTVASLAGCGGSTHTAPDHATLHGVAVLRDAVVFDFDVRPADVKAEYPPRSALAECGSGLPVRPKGKAVAVVHFSPAQTDGVPKRIEMPSGTVLDVWKLCDFEADVGWAIGLSHRAPVHVSRDGATVTVTFGG